MRNTKTARERDFEKRCNQACKLYDSYMQKYALWSKSRMVAKISERMQICERSIYNYLKYYDTWKQQNS